MTKRERRKAALTGWETRRQREAEAEAARQAEARAEAARRGWEARRRREAEAEAKQEHARRSAAGRRGWQSRRLKLAGASPIFMPFVEPLAGAPSGSMRQVYAMVRFDRDEAYDIYGYDYDEVAEANGVTNIIPVKMPRHPLSWYRSKTPAQIAKMIRLAMDREVSWIIDEETGAETRAFYGLVVKRVEHECKAAGRALAREREAIREARDAADAKKGRSKKNVGK